MILGIVGGIGAGKSTVARLFREAGCRSIDADEVAHRVLEREDVREQVAERFGDVFTDDGSVDRGALARVVFGREEDLAALNSMIHPHVREWISSEIRNHRERLRAGELTGREVVLVLDVSLLATSPLREECDSIVFVDADRAVRLDRCRSRGWSAEQMDLRESHQASLDEKRRLARRVISNSGSLEETRRQVLQTIAELETEQPETPPPARPEAPVPG